MGEKHQIDNKNIVHLHVPFEVITIEELLERHKATRKLQTWHVINFNALFIVTSNAGKHDIDCEEYHFKAGDIIPLVKNQIHRFHKEFPITGTAITFTEDFILKNISEANSLLFLKIFHLPKIQIDKDAISLLNPFIDLLFKEQAIINTGVNADIIRSILVTVFLYIERLAPLDFVKSDTKRFKDFIKFKTLVSENFKKTHHAKDYAKLLNVSYKHINDISKEFSGKTAKAFIDFWLVTEIKRNISQQSYNIKEISYRVGFEEPTNFIRFFKKHTGQTPKEYSL